MSNGKSGKKKILTTIISLVLVVVASIFGIDLTGILDMPDTNVSETVSNETSSSIEAVPVEGALIVTMRDVGQADCLLFEQDGMTALVDCGTRFDGDEVLKFLEEKGITKLDYLFGTHPHDDHMGGMQEVIMNIPIGKIIIPDADIKKATSGWYKELLKELLNGDYNLEYSKAGSIYELGDAKIHVITQFTEYKSDLNNYSAIMKVSFGEMDMIMTGDAEVVVEEEALKSGVSLDAEILKSGHHGSHTSSSDAFIDAISPDYVMISVGLGNKHEHPIKSTMDKYQKRDIKVYRTDESGTVVATITTNSVSFNTDPDDYLDGITAEKRYGKND